MSNTFSVILYDKSKVKKAPLLRINSILSSVPTLKSELHADKFIEASILENIDALFYLPNASGKMDAYYKAVSLFYENELISDFQQSLTKDEEFYFWIYTDLSDNEQGSFIQEKFEEFRMIEDGESGVNYKTDRTPKPTLNEDIYVDPKEFGAKDESDSKFREEDYIKEIARKRKDFSFSNLVYENIGVTEADIIRVLINISK